MQKVTSFVVISVLMAACGRSPIQPTPAPSTPLPPSTYSIAGTVFEATADGSRGIADASVMFGKDHVTLTASTDENGEFSLEGITTGTWQLFIAKEGYETQIIVVEVQANKSLEVELKAVMNE
jgi:hypothetical protein